MFTAGSNSSDLRQSGSNLLQISPKSTVSYDVIYEEHPENIDLNKEKFLSQAHVFLQLNTDNTRQLSAELTTPNYPSSYPNSADVSWLIEAPQSDTLSLRIQDLEIEDCCDRLTIYDGYSNFFTVLAQLTGSFNPSNADFLSSSRYLFLQFTSDCSLTKRGFKGRVNVVAGNAPSATTLPSYINNTCSGVQYLYVYTHRWEYVTSPGYPSSYANGLDCGWRISTSYYGYVIQLDVVDIELESGYDYVDVYDGSSTSSTKIARLSYQNSTLYSTGTYMYLHFHTDNSVTRKGFHLKFKAVNNPVTTNSPDIPSYSSPSCYERLELYSGYGYISSPNYPSYYYSNADCDWFIDGHYSGYRVRLQVVEFRLNSGDKVRVYDGSSASYPLIESLYGTIYSKTIYSTGKDIFINFKSDSYYENKGFKFHYSAIYGYDTIADITTSSYREETTSLPTCSSSTVSLYPQRYNYYSLQSPGYPYGYGTYLSCRWRIYRHYSSDIVKVIVDYMNIEASGDYLRLYDGYDTSYRTIATLSGTTRGTYYSTGAYMYLYFTTNYRTTSSDKGFQLRYTSVSRYDGTQTTTSSRDYTTATNFQCMHTMDLPVYTYKPTNFTSPGYPYSYPYSDSYCWQFKTYSYYYIVQLIILDMQINDCCGSIKIYDGPTDDYNLLETFTGDTTAVIYSTGTSLFVKLESYGYGYHKGFHAVATVIDRLGCTKEMKERPPSGTSIPAKPNTTNATQKQTIEPTATEVVQNQTIN